MPFYSFVQVGQLGSLATFGILAMMCLLIQPTLANNEIINFGPILCRADEVGHLEDKAARQVSRDWCVTFFTFALFLLIDHFVFPPFFPLCF